MSHEFKLKYNQLRQNDPTAKEADKNYESESYARNVCFVQLDGKMTFLGYSYLISGEYLPDENAITLTFTSHTINLKGINLELLFLELMKNLPKMLTCSDERYNQLASKENYCINQIEIIPKT